MMNFALKMMDFAGMQAAEQLQRSGGGDRFVY